MTHLRFHCHDRVTALLVAAGLVPLLAGCSNTRAWGAGAAGGFLVGTGAAVAISLALDPGEGTEKTGIVLGSAVGGAILGTLVGHYLFDPEKDSAKVASVPPPPPIADPDAVAHGGSDANVR